MSESDQQNPFAAPQVETVSATIPLTNQSEVRSRFRQQSRALGASWIVMRLLTMMAITNSSTAPFPGKLQELATLFGFAGLLLIVLGALTLSKQVGAIYVGLVLTYGYAIVHLISLSVIFVAFMVMMIVQGHRVIRWAATLRKDGIAL